MDSLTLLGTVADLIGIAGAVFALLAWMKARQVQQGIENERKRQNKKIIVSLFHGGTKIDLPIEIRRAEFTRSEILGRIGMIPMKQGGKRFSLAYLNTPEFLQKINQIAQGEENDVLIISCSEEEMNQFQIG